ncbi:MAG: pantetheine-phosphate adenylyltransferase [Clostridia bacterium]|nr:pantetheine-phosphate adenylyltransferase [Clostridia bacterium]
MNAIVTGSFDPMTIGHCELVRQASEKFDMVYVVALVNANKKHMFTLEQRKQIIELSVGEYENVVADAYDGLTVDYMHKMNITQIIRGIKNEQEIEYEKNLANIMKEYDSGFETTFLVCDEKFSEISSTLVRDLLNNGESIENYVHKNALEKINEMYIQNQN